jgi:CRISPR-associated protein Csb2
VFQGVLDALADPPSYRTPHAVPGHTRHYLPDLDHLKGEQGRTDLTLDPFLSIRREDELLVRWDADLNAEQRAALAKLAELLPYLGRSESVCEAWLRDDELVPDESWWRPGTGPQRLLTVTRPVSRTVLETTTTDIRKRRRTMPPGCTWVSYTMPPAPEAPRESERSSELVVNAIRFAVLGRVPMKATHGLLLADRAHERAGQLLLDAQIPDARRKEIMGTRGADTDHHHAHWIALPESATRGAPIRHLVVWVPARLRTEEVQAILSLRSLSGRRGVYEVSGFPEVAIRFQAAGKIEEAVPELVRPSCYWRSLTPYLPVRHRKRESIGEYVAADVGAELRYRGLPAAVSVSRLEAGTEMTDRWSSEFRRHRLRERLERTRPGLGLRLEFAEPVAGPLLLGQLSHFGFGIFEPDLQ